jgi:hypothetical protein
MDLMIDLEGLATGPDTCILTIAAQAFDPFGIINYEQSYYARVTLESQPDRAFNEEGRIPLDQALDELGKLIWHSKRIWAQGPTYDMNILEHAYKSYHKTLPWKYFQVCDSRTLFRLWPDQPIPPTSHHALEDCRRQIGMLQNTLKYLNITELK